MFNEIGAFVFARREYSPYEGGNELRTTASNSRRLTGISRAASVKGRLRSVLINGNAGGR